MTVKPDTEAPSSPSVFASPLPLPRGPHELTREEVAESQRTRLMAGFTELMAAHGYAGVRLADLVSCAGVSKATFYEHFADKEQCMLAAYEQYLRTLIEVIGTVADDDTPRLEDFVGSIVTRYLEAIRRDLTASRAFFVELEGAGAVARARRRFERQAFIALLKERHQHFLASDPSLAPLPTISYEAIVDAAREIVRDRLDSELHPDLMGLVPDLTLTFTAIFQGAAAAQP